MENKRLTDLNEYVTLKLNRQMHENVISFRVYLNLNDKTSISVKINQADHLINFRIPNYFLFDLVKEASCEQFEPMGGNKDFEKQATNDLQKVTQPIHYDKFEEIPSLIVKYFEDFIF